MGYGSRSIDEMSFAWVTLTYLEEADFQQRVEARRARARPASRRSHERGDRGSAHRPVWLVAVRDLVGGARGVARARRRRRRPDAAAPTEITAIHFNAGQAVVPYFEGWIRNRDGTFDLVFGYFNRNYQQEFAIPVGPDNKVEPAGLPAGPPTYFLPRRQRFLFRLRVPADFGTKEVVWTLTANGRTERGYGSLQPAQEITERVVMTNGNFDPGHDDPNQAPTITIAPIPRNVVVGSAVTLTASVVDDGLPKPRAAAPAPPPTAGGRIIAQVNTSAQRARGLTVSWLEYRGPGKVTFGAAGPTPVANGEGTVNARFCSGRLRADRIDNRRADFDEGQGQCHGHRRVDSGRTVTETGN